jgi:LuxR family maltose regulon positive regulatory protein
MPAVVGEVERRRVLRLLAGDAAVVVLSAPAGSGKSIAARQWIAADGRATATVRLSGHLDDAVSLAQVLLDALETFGDPAPRTRARMTGKEPAFSVAELPALATVTQNRSRPFVLLVDDVHVLQSPAAQQVLAAVCESVPNGSTVALLSRSLTPAWLARVRTTGRVTELSAADLAFDSDEAREVLAAIGAVVGPSTVADILEHTEGWAVGVYLTALSLRAGEAAARPNPRLTRGSDLAVADYLRTQVLATLSDDHRRFLTLTSVLDELDGPLCDALLDRTDSAAVLADLHRRIQLLEALDGPDEPRYRCHHLLAEELRADLRTSAPLLIPQLRERACRWFDAHGDRESAIRHATASGDMDLAARVLWPAVPACVASGRLEQLRGWLGGFSDRQLAENRWLTLAATWAALQHGDAVAMRRWAGIADAHAGPDWREAARDDPYAATVAVLHALVGAGGPEDTRDLCDRALGGLPPQDSFRAAAEFIKAVALTLQRDVDGGVASLLESAELARALDVPVIEANAMSWLGLLALEAGDRQRGMRLVSEGAEVSRRHHLDRLATGALSATAQALVVALAGDRSAASASLVTARRLTGLAGAIAPWFAVSGRLFQARTAVLLGDGATARVLITEARTHLTPELQASAVGEWLAETESILVRTAHHGGAAGVLTTTELRVLQFLPSHLTVQQISEHLFVSPTTVKTHVQSIYRKFGVRSRAAAVAHARALGLVESPIDG